LITDLIEISYDYLSRVVDTSLYPIIGKIQSKNAEEYKYNLEQLDTIRRRTHQSLISSARIVDRYCQENCLPLVYGGDYNDRRKVAEFAKILVDEYFKKGLYG